MSNAKHLRMRAFIQTHPLLVPKALWVLIVLWYELGNFYHSSSCAWPKLNGDASPKPEHVLVVADPQMLDENSYPGRPPWLMTLTQFIVDNFLRKAWRVAISKRPDAVVFLGDMLDNGRAEWDEARYRAHVAKFRRIFKPPIGVPVYYLPGNHDVWLGGADERAQVARARFEGHFGPRNGFAVVGNHTLVFVDAPQLVEDDRARARERTGPGDVSGWIPPAIRELKQRVDRASPHNPIVLFSHIPLTRPDDADCGPLREKGTLRAGRGFGYENTLSEVVSGMLLDTFRPVIVFSGDDHDYCDITHTVAQSDNRAGSATGVHEVSVKSLSMAMGIRRPGFQLLSLASLAQPSFAHSPCLLPDQLGTYMYRYAPLFAMTFFGLLVVAARDSDRTRARSKRDEQVLLPSSWAGAKEYHAYATGSRRNSGMTGLTGRIVRALERTTHGRIVLYFGIVAWPALLAFVLVHLWIL